ncbi:hypothetical protein FG386_002745 [Cryptosporidium ryanae]|uniref:uncharacterized protein n=1 Tax=Cryptosporidium ryanae TaxID=515981 RepID=UPI00351A7F53|nr:hypothetical protein FG386_002745 [Cryptosporidium ryanae]
MSGYNVSRYTIESKKFHKSEQRGHLSLKYRKENVEHFKEKEQGAEVNRPESLSNKYEDDVVKNLGKSESNNQTDNSENEMLISGDINDDVGEEELDEDEELLLELEKIRRERQEKEKEEKSNKIKLMMKSNPLLNLPQDEDPSYNRKTSNDSEKDESYDDYVLKRSWMDDTVFKNQCKYREKKKRFINDTLHNDFHKEFMKKYIS